MRSCGRWRPHWACGENFILLFKIYKVLDEQLKGAKHYHVWCLFTNDYLESRNTIMLTRCYTKHVVSGNGIVRVLNITGTLMYATFPIVLSFVEVVRKGHNFLDHAANSEVFFSFTTYSVSNVFSSAHKLLRISYFLDRLDTTSVLTVSSSASILGQCVGGFWSNFTKKQTIALYICYSRKHLFVANTCRCRKTP